MAPRTTSGASRRSGSPLTPYLFLLPYLALFVTFVMIPGVFGLWISLHDWDYMLDSKLFVGFENYANLLDENSVVYPDFWNGMKNTLIFVVLSVPLLVVLPLLLALLLHQKFPGRTFFRAMFFAPYVLGVAVIGLMWRYLLDGNFGIINSIFGTDIAWTTSQPWAWIGLVIVTVWWTMGFNAIIYLAGLGDIPTEQYEAAELDGAGGWGKFVNVTIPGLRPVLIFIVVITLIASANMFGQSYLITAGGPTQSTQTAIMVITELGLSRFQMGAAAAESYVLALFLAVVSIVNFWIMRDRDEVAQRKALKAQRRAQESADKAAPTSADPRTMEASR
ncbi:MULTISPECIES: carbohydrate ABC transporter permease [unclassified Ornithinimicrobium]|uniref:carbohydrate ABC transporter permease n=1 Tax=unclassified Ornithinimicrobium TaxID=2615080 RepID=UPI003854134A